MTIVTGARLKTCFTTLWIDITSPLNMRLTMVYHDIARSSLAVLVAALMIGI